MLGFIVLLFNRVASLLFTFVWFVPMLGFVLVVRFLLILFLIGLLVTVGF